MRYPNTNFSLGNKSGNISPQRQRFDIFSEKVKFFMGTVFFNFLKLIFYCQTDTLFISKTLTFYNGTKEQLQYLYPEVK